MRSATEFDGEHFPSIRGQGVVLTYEGFWEFWKLSLNSLGLNGAGAEKISKNIGVSKDYVQRLLSGQTQPTDGFICKLAFLAFKANDDEEEEFVRKPVDYYNATIQAIREGRLEMPS